MVNEVRPSLGFIHSSSSEIKNCHIHFIHLGRERSKVRINYKCEVYQKVLDRFVYYLRAYGQNGLGPFPSFQERNQSVNSDIQLRDQEDAPK
jgi:hypothetical protein